MGALRWSQVDTKNWTISVGGEQRGNKAGELFAHPIPKYLVDVVFKPRLPQRDAGGVWVLPSIKRAGRPMRNVRGSLKTALKRHTGLSLTTHDLRRTAASLIYAATQDMLLTKRLLTHSLSASADRDTTSAGYVISSTKDLRDALDATVAFVLRIVREGTWPESSGERYDERAASDEGFENEAATIAQENAWLDHAANDDEESAA